MSDQTPLTAESEALLERVTSDWDMDPYGEYDRAKASLVADLRAVEAAAARRAIERVRAVASDLDSRGMGLAALSLLEVIESSAALPRPEEPPVERCAFEGCGAERVSWRHLRCAQSEPDPCPDPCPAMDGGCHPFTPEVR